MRTAILGAAMLFVGVIGGSMTVSAAPAVPDRLPAVSHTIPVQGHREHCRYLRGRLHELEERRAYAPPWEQRRLERRIHETRGELRESGCF